METILFNKCQTPFEELELEKYPKEVVDDKNHSVYRHTSPSGKVYVGITKLTFQQRWKKDGEGYKRCKLFNRAIQKYGWNNIKHEIVLSNVSENEAYYAEKYLIRWYKMHNLSYNLTDGGEGTTGCVMPEDAKRKISQYLKENRGRPVLQYTLEGKLIQEFKSASEAAKILGYGHASVINCASGIKRENTLHGFIFIYKDEIEKLLLRLKLCKNHRRKYKIIQYKKGKIINIFDSIRDAERITGINRLCISRNIRGIFKHAGKYIWKKVMDKEIYGNAI